MWFPGGTVEVRKVTTEALDWLRRCSPMTPSQYKRRIIPLETKNIFYVFSEYSGAMENGLLDCVRRLPRHQPRVCHLGLRGRAVVERHPQVRLPSKLEIQQIHRSGSGSNGTGKGLGENGR